jgi:hypothetical protein
MKRLLLALLFTVSLQAQEKDQTRLFTLKYADGRELNRILSAFGAKVDWESNSNTLAVHGSKESIEGVAEALKTLDVPHKVRDVELTFYLLIASEKPGPGETLPPTLSPVLTQLRGIFQYKDYRLLQTSFVRVRDGERVSTSGLLPTMNPDVKVNPTYSIQANRVRVAPDDKDSSVRLEQLAVQLKIPVMTSAQSIDMTTANISTDVDIRDGQKIVVGKANVTSAQDAVIVVVTAKLVN